MTTKDYDIQKQDILICDDILEACCGTYNDYLLHIFITQGGMSFRMDNKVYHAQSGSGIILLQGMTLHDILLSEDTKAVILLKSRRYHLAHPQRTPHNIKGLTYYYDNPIMQMNAQDMELCLRDLDDIKCRLSQTDHIYHQFSTSTVSVTVIRHQRGVGRHSWLNTLSICCSNMCARKEQLSFMPKSYLSLPNTCPGFACNLLATMPHIGLPILLWHRLWKN